MRDDGCVLALRRVTAALRPRRSFGGFKGSVTASLRQRATAAIDHSGDRPTLCLAGVDNDVMNVRVTG